MQLQWYSFPSEYQLLHPHILTVLSREYAFGNHITPQSAVIRMKPFNDLAYGSLIVDDPQREALSDLLVGFLISSAISSHNCCKFWRTTMQRKAEGQIYHTGIWNRLSLSIPGAGHVHMMAPVPRFFSLTLSRTGKADASSALTFVPCLISIG